MFEMLIILKRIKVSFNKKKATKLNKNLFQGKVSQDYCNTPSYQQPWLMLPPGNCSLKTLHRKSQKQSISFKLPVILRSRMKLCIILFFLLGTWITRCPAYPYHITYYSLVMLVAISVINLSQYHLHHNHTCIQVHLTVFNDIPKTQE